MHCPSWLGQPHTVHGCIWKVCIWEGSPGARRAYACASRRSRLAMGSTQPRPRTIPHSRTSKQMGRLPRGRSLLGHGRGCAGAAATGTATPRRSFSIPAGSRQSVGPGWLSRSARTRAHPKLTHPSARKCGCLGPRVHLLCRASRPRHGEPLTAAYECLVMVAMTRDRAKSPEAHQSPRPTRKVKLISLSLADPRALLVGAASCRQCRRRIVCHWQYSAPLLIMILPY